MSTFFATICICLGKLSFTLLQPIEADNFLHSIAGTYYLRCSLV